MILNFIEEDVLKSIDLTITVTQMEISDKLNSLTDDMFEMEKACFDEYLVAFTFHLKLDPYFTEQGEVIPVHQMFELDGQTMTWTEVDLKHNTCSNLPMNSKFGGAENKKMDGLSILFTRMRIKISCIRCLAIPSGMRRQICTIL